MNPKQSRIPNFFNRSSRSRHEDSSDSDDVSLSLPSKVKEKLDKKWKWTRVHDIEKAVNQPVNSVDVLQDLQSDMTLKMIRKSAVHELGVLMFDPEVFNDQKSQLTIARYRLGRDQLLDYAKMASRIRRTISR